jgi:hypothetical protein
MKGEYAGHTTGVSIIHAIDDKRRRELRACFKRNTLPYHRRLDHMRSRPVIVL